jgi:hypothetical protein
MSGQEYLRKTRNTQVSPQLNQALDKMERDKVIVASTARPVSFV